LEVSRGQNVVYQMPHDWASIARFLEPLVARVDAAQNGLQLLVVTPDAEVAAAVSASAVRLLGSADVQIIAATAAATRIVGMMGRRRIIRQSFPRARDA